MHPTNTGAALAATFDPTEWLNRFETLGGAYSATDSSLHLGFLSAHQTDAETIAARMMIADLTTGDRAAIFAHLRSQTGEA
jgi:hypothetical protein